MLLPLEELIRESDVIVIAELSQPESEKGTSEDIRSWTAKIKVVEVLYGDVDPGQMLELHWLETVGDSFNRHYEKYKGQRLLWLLKVDDKKSYSAAEAGRCRILDDKEKVKSLINSIHKKPE